MLCMINWINHTYLHQVMFNYSIKILLFVNWQQKQIIDIFDQPRMLVHTIQSPHWNYLMIFYTSQFKNLCNKIDLVREIDFRVMKFSFCQFNENSMSRGKQWARVQSWSSWYHRKLWRWCLLGMRKNQLVAGIETASLELSHLRLLQATSLLSNHLGELHVPDKKPKTLCKNRSYNCKLCKVILQPLKIYWSFL